MNRAGRVDRRNVGRKVKRVEFSVQDRVPSGLGKADNVESAFRVTSLHLIELSRFASHEYESLLTFNVFI